ncbi:MAG: hypothetical protein COA86_14095 [Kangiella sp.]|nr:MAG: hypothetical protein COA86_14095 [Kangiella sp.]
MNKVKLIGAILIMAVSGCSTIHFDRGEQVTAKKVTQEWHHNFALALYEGSPAVDLNSECRDMKWSSVKTETTFVNGIAGGAVNLVAPIWYPKTVEVSCK